MAVVLLLRQRRELGIVPSTSTRASAPRSAESRTSRVAVDVITVPLICRSASHGHFCNAVPVSHLQFAVLCALFDCRAAC